MQRETTTSRLNHRQREHDRLSQYGQALQFAGHIESDAGSSFGSLEDPVEDGAANWGRFSDFIVHTGSANFTGTGQGSNPGRLALKSTVWMVNAETGGANRAGKVEFVRVRRSDGEYRFFPSVAF